MKKTLALLLVFSLLAISLCACAKTPKIQKKTWKLSAVVTDETEITLEGSLTAKRGTITFTDATNGKTYTGSYSDRDEFSPTASDYRITLEGVKGRALIAVGQNVNGDPITTLSLIVGAYTLVFIAED